MNFRKLLSINWLFLSMVMALQATEKFEKEETGDRNTACVSTYNKIENLLPVEIWYYIASDIDIQSLAKFAQAHSYFNRIVESYDWHDRLERLNVPETIVSLLPCELTAKEKFKRLALGIQLNLETDFERINLLITKHQVTSLYPHLWTYTYEFGTNPSELANKGLHCAIENLFTICNRRRIDFILTPYPEESQSLIDSLIARGNRASVFCQNKIRYFSLWKRNPSDPEVTLLRKEMDDDSVDQEVLKLQEIRHMTGIAEAQQYWDGQIEKGNYTALDLKLMSMNGEIFEIEEFYPMKIEEIYPINQPLIEKLLEEGCALNKQIFLYTRLQSYLNGAYGIPKDLEKAHQFIEDLVERQQPIGFIYKLSGLKRGDYGYQKNEQEALRFIRENGLPF